MILKWDILGRDLEKALHQSKCAQKGQEKKTRIALGFSGHQFKFIKMGISNFANMKYEKRLEA